MPEDATMNNDERLSEEGLSMTPETREEIWDFLLDNNIATGSELYLVTNVAGYTVDVLNDVLFVQTGYRSIDQYTDE